MPDPHELPTTKPSRHARVPARGVALGIVIGVTACIAAGLVGLAGRCADTPPLDDGVMGGLAAQGVAPGLVYTVELPGYELADQSVGVVGEEGFGAIYVSPEGSQVELTVDWGQFSDGMCTEMPIPHAVTPTAPTTCERDGTGWYRAGGGRHDYVVARRDHLLRLNAPIGDVDRTTLDTAVTHAHHVTAAASDTTAPPSSPPERRDLPATGDGAPNNIVGPAAKHQIGRGAVPPFRKCCSGRGRTGAP